MGLKLAYYYVFWSGVNARQRSDHSILWFTCIEQSCHKYGRFGCTCEIGPSWFNIVRHSIPVPPVEGGRIALFIDGQNMQHGKLLGKQ